MKKKLTAIVIASCLTLGLGTGYLIGEARHSPKTAYVIWDFNRDGRADLTIEKSNGEKVNLYNIEKDEYNSTYPFKYYTVK